MEGEAENLRLGRLTLNADIGSHVHQRMMEPLRDLKICAKIRNQSAVPMNKCSEQRNNRNGKS